MDRITIALEGELAERLGRLAERMRIQPGTLAAALLSAALDDADPAAHEVVELLDGIRDAHHQAELGLRQATARQTVALDELAIRGT
jgi:predicted transcriptional regulator